MKKQSIQEVKLILVELQSDIWKTRTELRQIQDTIELYETQAVAIKQRLDAQFKKEDELKKMI